MVRRAIWAVAAAQAMCAGGAGAWADQVVLKPVAAGGYSEVEGYSPTIVAANNSIGPSLSVRIQSPHTVLYGYGLLEYSLKSLPVGAVVTSATMMSTIDWVRIGTGRVQFPGPFALGISTYDGVDGQITLADVSRFSLSVWGPETLGATETPFVHTTSFSDLTFLRQRDGYAGIILRDLGDVWSGAAFDLTTPPVLMITYTVPEAGSVGVLGVGVVMSLRRRR